VICDRSQDTLSLFGCRYKKGVVEVGRAEHAVRLAHTGSNGKASGARASGAAPLHGKGGDAVDYEGLQLVIGLGLTDQQFMSTLMTDRPRALAGLSLSEEEVGVLLAARENHLKDLSRRVDSWIQRRTRPARRGRTAVGVNDWL
jgi:hypothetical protein